jgi:hypothetical protein
MCQATGAFDPFTIGFTYTQKKTVAAHVGNAQEGQYLHNRSNQPRLPVHCIMLVPHRAFLNTFFSIERPNYPTNPNLYRNRPPCRSGSQPSMTWNSPGKRFEAMVQCRKWKGSHRICQNGTQSRCIKHGFESSAKQATQSNCISLIEGSRPLLRFWTCPPQLAKCGKE